MLSFLFCLDEGESNKGVGPGYSPNGPNSSVST